MEAIRRIMTVRDNVLKIELPDSYNDRRVELIILPAEEAIPKVEETKVDYEKLYGSLKSGLTPDEIDKQLNTLRSEWNGISLRHQHCYLLS